MPISKDPIQRAKQIANLRRGGPPAKPGNRLAWKHGGRSALLVADVEAEILELMSALGDAAPVKEGGELPAADVAAVERCARALKRWRHLSQWLDLHGRLDDRGNVKPAAELELKAERELAAALEALAMTPASRAKIGVDIARGLTAAERLEAHLAQTYGGGAIDGEEVA
jgi:hypothetical protein